ncbi:MAG: META domain-containing protein [Acidobacteriota bacterium]|nr:META domain-containing protein [Acidobacteriota bacterium]
MRIVRIIAAMTLALVCTCFAADAQQEKLSVIGKLVRVSAIGGESTGWAIQLESEINMAGKQVKSIEVEAHKMKKLEALENKRVRATGTLSHRHGVETGDRSVLEVSSIGEVKATPTEASQPATAASAALNLTGSEWLLEDLAGSGVIDRVQATLAFPEVGKVSGNGSCNRFFGASEISGHLIKLGPFGTTRMACPEAVMDQETKYLNALQAAERFDWKDPYLLLYVKILEKPLRFTRK